MTGDQQDRHGRVACHGVLGEIVPVHPRQAHVGDEEIEGGLLRQALHSRFSVSDRSDVIAAVFENVLHRFADGDVVLYKKDARVREAVIANLVDQKFEESCRTGSKALVHPCDDGNHGKARASSRLDAVLPRGLDTQSPPLPPGHSHYGPIRPRFAGSVAPRPSRRNHAAGVR